MFGGVRGEAKTGRFGVQVLRTTRQKSSGREEGKVHHSLHTHPASTGSRASCVDDGSESTLERSTTSRRPPTTPTRHFTARDLLSGCQINRRVSHVKTHSLTASVRLALQRRFPSSWLYGYVTGFLIIEE